MVAWWQARLSAVGPWIEPARRRRLLGLVAAVAALVYPAAKLAGRPQVAWPSAWREVGTATAILLAVVYACYLAAVRFSRLPAPVRRRPVLVLHGGYWLLLAGLWSTAGARGAWRTVATYVALALPFLLWRCAYLLRSGQRGHAAGSRFTDHLFYVYPVFGGTDTPQGKGYEFLRRHEARSPEALARSQLAGLRLLLLALLWTVVLQLVAAAVDPAPEGWLAAAGGWTLGIPRLRDLVARGGGVALPLAWASLYLELVVEVLRLAAETHVYVGVLRLLGFHVFRNTYKPLLAESVVEFWNRYFYYFKELLLEFFFFPTFARRFRMRPAARIVAAVFAAAFAGNLYFHLLERESALVRGDVAAAVQSLRSRAVYCFLLAAGISVSMLRERHRRGRPEVRTGTLRRIARIAGVWTFFGVIRVWAVGAALPTPAQRLRFLLSLVGLG